MGLIEVLLVLFRETDVSMVLALLFEESCPEPFEGPFPVPLEGAGIVRPIRIVVAGRLEVLVSDIVGNPATRSMVTRSLEHRSFFAPVNVETDAVNGFDVPDALDSFVGLIPVALEREAGTLWDTLEPAFEPDFLLTTTSVA